MAKGAAVGSPNGGGRMLTPMTGRGDSKSKRKVFSSHKGGVAAFINVENAAADEDALSKGFRENQGLFLMLGAMYRNSTFSWVHTFCFLVVAVPLHYCLIYTAFLLTEDIALLFETLHWVTILTGVFFMTLCFSVKQHRYERLFRSFGQNVYSYSTLDEESELKVSELRVSSSTEKMFLSKVFTSMVLTTLIIYLIILPSLAIYTGTFFEPQRSDGVVIGVPCVTWVPIAVPDDWIVIFRLLVLVGQGYTAFTVIFSVIGQQTTAICIGNTLLYEFKVLTLTLENFDLRARRLFHKLNPTTRDPQMGLPECLRLALEDSIKHHQILIDLANEYESICYYALLVVLINSTLSLCLSSISLNSDVPNESKALALVFTASELAYVFVNCYYGQVLLDAHDMISNAVYNSNWIPYSSLVRQHILIITTRTIKPLSLTAAGFTIVNLATFAQVVKSSFSFYSLLQAVQE